VYVLETLNFWLSVLCFGKEMKKEGDGEKEGYIRRCGATGHTYKFLWFKAFTRHDIGLKLFREDLERKDMS
jgi:hypothetical protein